MFKLSAIADGAAFWKVFHNCNSELLHNSITHCATYILQTNPNESE